MQSSLIFILTISKPRPRRFQKVAWHYQKMISAICAIGNLPRHVSINVKEYVSSVFNNVNVQDYDRHTALYVAASEGHLEVVKYLVNKGANDNRSDR